MLVFLPRKYYRFGVVIGLLDLKILLFRLAGAAAANHYTVEEVKVYIIVILFI